MSNFWTRTLTGAAFLVVMVFGLIWDRAIFGALFVTILWIALQEFYRMALGTRFRFQQKLGLVAGAAAFLLVSVWFPILGNPGMDNLPQCILVAFVAAFAIWKHKSNIQRLAKGCENKIY